MDWMRQQDVKEEPQEASNTLTPEDDDECYFEEDVSIDEGMVREISHIAVILFAIIWRIDSIVLRKALSF